MDGYPINTGHTLVLPKKHHKDIFTMGDDGNGQTILNGFFLGKGIVKALDSKGAKYWTKITGEQPAKWCLMSMFT